MTFRSGGRRGPPGPEGPEGPEGPPGPPTWRGAWASGTDYSADDAVHHNGAAWFATTDPAVGDEPGVASAWDLLADQGDTGPEGPQGPEGPEGPEGPQGPAGSDGDPIVWRGTWDSGTAYAELDAVAYNAESWIANQATNAGDEPGVSAKWDRMAASGGNDPHAEQHRPNGSDALFTPVADESSLPAAGTQGRLAIAQNGDGFYYDDGAQWINLGGGGDKMEVIKTSGPTNLSLGESLSIYFDMVLNYHDLHVEISADLDTASSELDLLMTEKCAVLRNGAWITTPNNEIVIDGGSRTVTFPVSVEWVNAANDPGIAVEADGDSCSNVELRILGIPNP